MHGRTFGKGERQGRKEEEKGEDGGLRRRRGEREGEEEEGEEPLSLCRGPQQRGALFLFFLPFPLPLLHRLLFLLLSPSLPTARKQKNSPSPPFHTEKNRASKQNFYHQSALLTVAAGGGLGYTYSTYVRYDVFGSRPHARTKLALMRWPKADSLPSYGGGGRQAHLFGASCCQRWGGVVVAGRMETCSHE